MIGAPPNNLADKPFGIYVHWPWCASKCPYCDFNSHVARFVDQDQMADDLCTELVAMAARTPHRTVHSIFFGGGTPSLMEGAVLARIMAQIRDLWPFSNLVEISMEANPSSVDAARFADYAAAGVSRLSLGVQALGDKDLQALGRLHTAAEAMDAIALARQHFTRLSFDLIYARPGQSLKAWEHELTRALDLGPDHLSLYQLTFEPGTPFHALREAGKMVPLDDDKGADLFEVTQELCEKAGLPAYEISNHARPGSECRHNLIYWRMHDYIGVGPGAHGRFDERISTSVQRSATVTHSDPAAWSAQVRRQGHGLMSDEAVTPADQATELLLMGLRLEEGISLARFEALAALSQTSLSQTPLSLATGPLRDLEENGFITINGDTLKTTPAGRPLLNTILKSLLA